MQVSLNVTVARIHPTISEIKQKLIDADALYAAMSGSGSSVFALFPHGYPCKNLKELFPGTSFFAQQ